MRLVWLHTCRWKLIRGRSNVVSSSTQKFLGYGRKKAIYIAHGSCYTYILVSVRTWMKKKNTFGGAYCLCRRLVTA